MESRRQNSVMNRQDGAEESSDTSGSLQMAETGFRGTRREGRLAAVELCKCLCQRFDFNRIPQGRTGAVGLDVANRLG